MENRKSILKNFEKYKGYTEDRVNHGIEQNRKAFATITIKNKNGSPLSNVAVKAEQTEHSFKYGANIFMLDELENDEKNRLYKEYFKGAFNMATIPFYWDDLEPEKGKTRYGKNSPKIYRRPATDLCMEFCRENNIEPREHALAYEHYFPDWLKDESVAVIKRELERHFGEIAERYADKINTIEVTNEMEWPEGKTAFYRVSDYVEWCYKTAAKYFPNNQLVINEWSGVWEDYCETLSRYYLTIENALLKGARIDAVGVQYHMFYKQEEEVVKTEKFYNPMVLYKTLDTYSKLHLPVQITEVTIPAYSNEREDEDLQAEIIERLYSIWFSHPNVEQIIYWNLVDGYAAFAPQGDMTSGENYYYGGLLHFDLTPKPAYYTIKNLFEKKWHTSENLTSDCNGTVAFKGFKGKYDLSFDVGGKKTIKKIEITGNYQKDNNIEIVID